MESARCISARTQKVIEQMGQVTIRVFADQRADNYAFDQPRHAAIATVVLLA
jgi:hypothetical protein